MRRLWLCVPLLTLMVMPATAQRNFGGGSTVQGDYLRGLGVFEAGLGLYNVRTAQAESINADTAMRVDNYFNEIFRQNRENWNKLDKEREAKVKANYDRNVARISEHPERLDVFTGNALNSAMKDLNNPAIQEASFRSIEVPIPREMLRRIPFKMDEKGLVFSIQRLTARGKGKWPVAFQQDSFEPERRAYDKAIDQAMGEMIDGKVLKTTIDAYDAAVEALGKKLIAVSGSTNNVVYQEANFRVQEMRRASKMIGTLKMQPVMAELDRYTGKNVNDLRQFMMAHNLRFAAVDTADERKLYVDLYASIDTYRRIVAPRAKGGDQ